MAQYAHKAHKCPHDLRSYRLMCAHVMRPAPRRKNRPTDSLKSKRAHNERPCRQNSALRRRKSSLARIIPPGCGSLSGNGAVQSAVSIHELGEICPLHFGNLLI
jgi:hypothetical protein